jgi:hypothetical protein
MGTIDTETFLVTCSTCHPAATLARISVSSKSETHQHIRYIEAQESLNLSKNIHDERRKNNRERTNARQENQTSRNPGEVVGPARGPNNKKDVLGL